MVTRLWRKSLRPSVQLKPALNHSCAAAERPMTPPALLRSVQQVPRWRDTAGRRAGINCNTAVDVGPCRVILCSSRDGTHEQY